MFLRSRQLYWNSTCRNKDAIICFELTLMCLTILIYLSFKPYKHNKNANNPINQTHTISPKKTKYIMHPVEIKLNDQIYDPASSELIFLPGKPHTLHTTPKWEVLNQKSVITITKKDLPNGRIERRQSHCARTCQ